MPVLNVRDKDCITPRCHKGLKYTMYKTNYFSLTVAVKLLKVNARLKDKLEHQQRLRYLKYEQMLQRERQMVQQARARVARRADRRARARGRGGRGAAGRGRRRGRGRARGGAVAGERDPEEAVGVNEEPGVDEAPPPPRGAGRGWGRDRERAGGRGAADRENVQEAGLVNGDPMAALNEQAVVRRPQAPVVGQGAPLLDENVQDLLAPLIWEEERLLQPPPPLKDDLISQLQALSHENLARFIGIFAVYTKGKQYANCPCFEYGEGRGLEKALGSHELIQAKRNYSIIFQIASGLEYLHSNGLAHGYLTPSNVIFRDKERTRVMITDFCLPEKYHIRFSSPYLNRTVEEPYSSVCDIYSLAAVAASIIQNETFLVIPNRGRLLMQQAFADLRQVYRQRYDVIMSGLFETDQLRPSATEFKDAFAH
ncbi:dual specificity testis-specific protein kinase 1-like [Varroa jacobsoni]|uniref:dual specificity testis-specific protein kinase 1-like n=1 Tax=Varroa jacobsoni TaxID=62625 RepID=UPI000BF745A2|nr:dual specificity testis-specific protein kinase 1-like [Varroa jacobsoni]